MSLMAVMMAGAQNDVRLVDALRLRVERVHLTKIAGKNHLPLSPESRSYDS
jgi:hypothetical protein